MFIFEDCFLDNNFQLPNSFTLLSQQEWPTEILSDVLKELISETPPDLLQRELWCSSSSAENYWDIQKVSGTYRHYSAFIKHVIHPSELSIMISSLGFQEEDF